MYTNRLQLQTETLQLKTDSDTCLARSTEISAWHIDALYIIMTRLVDLFTLIDINGTSGRRGIIFCESIVTDTRV